MNVTITYNGDDISTTVTSYVWEKQICSGIGLAKISIDKKKASFISLSPVLYNVIEIIEEGVSKGKYYIHTIEYDLNSNSINLACQDASLKLQGYFVSDQYFIDYYSYGRTWIEKFLTDAGISYSFNNVGYGNPLPNDTTLGLEMASDIIQTLLQQSGWYMYFDSNNVAQIGKFSVPSDSVDHSFDGYDIIAINSNFSDKMFRNRVIVNEFEVDLSGNYEYEYTGSNGLDKRTVLIAGVSAAEGGASATLAYEAIAEFTKIMPVTQAVLVGSNDINLGQVISLSHDYINESGVVTTIGGSMGKDGLIINVTINERCPRLFSYFGYDGYVYVGTWGRGVWRKPLKGTSWEDYSLGLTNLYITDLAIDNGILGCTTGNGYAFYRNVTSGGWVRVNPTFRNVDGDIIQGHATCVTEKDKNSGSDLIFSFTTLSGENGVGYNQSTLAFVTSPTSVRTVPVVDEYEGDGYTVIDLETSNYGGRLVASVIANYSGEVYLWNNNNLTNYQLGNDCTYSGNTDKFLHEKGYTEIQFPDVSTVSPLYYKRILGDGRYVYIVEKIFSNDSATVGSFCTVSGATSINPDPYYDYDHSGGFIPTNDVVTVKDVVAIGNRGFFSVHADENYYLYAEIRDGVKQTQKTINLTVRGNLVGLSFRIADDKRRAYILVENLDVDSNPTGNLTLYGFDIDIEGLFNLGSYSFPATYHDGTYDYSRALSSGATDDYIVFVIGVRYSYNSYNADIPTLLKYNITNASIAVNMTIADTVYAENGWESLDSLSYSDKDNGLTNTDAFLLFNYDDGGFNSYGKYAKINLVSNLATIYSLDAAWSSYQVINGKNYFYIVEETATTTQLKDEWGNIAMTFPGTSQDLFFVQNPDDTDGGVFYVDYNDSTMQLHKYTSDGYQYSYDLNTKPDFTAYFGNPVRFSHQFSTGALVGDCIYLDFVTQYSFTFRQRECLLIPIAIVNSGITASGERLSTVDYTKYVKNEHYLMYSSNETGEFSEAFKLANPVNLTAAESKIYSTNDLYIAYGENTYSGIVIEGLQTGFEDGTMYRSFGGTSFMPANAGLVTAPVRDARIFNYLGSPSVSGETPGSVQVAIFPQKSGELSDLLIVSAGSLTSISPTGYVLETFSGEINHVETTNKEDYPYIFVSQSGIPAVFYQKDSYMYGEPSTVFVDQTYNLPTNTEITIIRCDDRI